MGFSSFLLWTKYNHGKLMTSSTHSFAYSYRLFKKCFDENYRNSKCHRGHIFLIFYPIHIKFSLLCSIFVLLFLLTWLKPGPDFSFKYSLNKKEWICSLFKEWILEKSEIRVNLEWTFVLFTHFGVTTGITQGFRVIPEVTPKWVNNTNVHSKFTLISLFSEKFTP